VGSALAEVSVKVIKAVIHWSFSRLWTTKTPFSKDGGSVSNCFEHFCNGGCAGGEGRLTFWIVGSKPSFFFVPSDGSVSLVETGHE
jgi:hypothetical protein